MASTLRAAVLVAAASAAFAVSPEAGARGPTPTPISDLASAAFTATARGSILGVSDPQYVDHPNPDGTVTNCELVGGTLRTDEGESINFAAGGVLMPDSSGGQGTLDPQADATIHTLQD